MAKRPDSSEVLTPRLSGFAPAIASLLALGLPAKRLAQIFGTNTNYIHVLAHRGRLSRSQQIARDELHSKNAITLLAREDSFEAKEALRIRAEEDAVELTGHKIRKLAVLQSWMEEIVNGGRNAYRFVQAAQALNALTPFVGYPSESSRLRFAAKLHQHLAWFYSHGGLTSPSIREATYSIRLYEIVYQNTGDSDALRELGGSCLIRSNSYLLQGDAKAALATLTLAKEATVAAGVPLNSEYFRQFGVALFQTRQDATAKTMFERAMTTIPDSDLKNGTMTLRMAGGI